MVSIGGIVTDSFKKALEHTLGIEGGFSDHDADRGGKTRFGITEETARRHGYTGRMDALPAEEAESIYRGAYWSAAVLPCEDIAIWSESIAMELFDTAVNMGPVQAALFFQVALNALNRDQSLYLDLTVDGWCGAVTLDALRYLPSRLDKSVCRKMLEVQQGNRYINIMKDHPDQEAFARGWFEHRITI